MWPTAKGESIRWVLYNNCAHERAEELINGKNPFASVGRKLLPWWNSFESVWWLLNTSSWGANNWSGYLGREVRRGSGMEHQTDARLRVTIQTLSNTNYQLRSPLDWTAFAINKIAFATINCDTSSRAETLMKSVWSDAWRSYWPCWNSFESAVDIEIPAVWEQTNWSGIAGHQRIAWRLPCKIKLWTVTRTTMRFLWTDCLCVF